MLTTTYDCLCAPGDPLEVSATAAIFAPTSPTHSRAFALHSSKSWNGHAEPSAGIVGVAHALSALAQRCHPSIMHLRMVNPLVGNALGTASSWLLPRQMAPAAAVQRSGESSVRRSGISGFAFQVGTVLTVGWPVLSSTRQSSSWGADPSP